ncbi:PA2169 family four-helix-bundle protein [Sphingomonas sp. S1-29]|uniref:ferritin-like domain-containing protein n=1 Tax=Sphingomonas sp. S1-29 TaxID=2991074 RepID=UPI00223EA3B0|nr:PA2169 family four-helix-bundle protein [Sphingomonas sp. S1-29]UZK70480.1 PA2169 family four-helix-bundle protein [Sphingomonas sp. S1-29]
MNQVNEVSLLNGLIKTTLDSMKGYEEAAKDAESTQYATMFAEFARDRTQVATELQGQVRTLGGEPEMDPSMLGAAHRTFMNLKEAITGHDDRAIIEEVERGEDHIKAKFEEAMADSELSPTTLAAITAGYASVREGHDKMSTLKHGMA